MVLISSKTSARSRFPSYDYFKMSMLRKNLKESASYHSCLDTHQQITNISAGESTCFVKRRSNNIHFGICCSKKC